MTATGEIGVLTVSLRGMMIASGLHNLIIADVSLHVVVVCYLSFSEFRDTFLNH